MDVQEGNVSFNAHSASLSRRKDMEAPPEIMEWEGEEDDHLFDEQDAAPFEVMPFSFSV